jgi:hypothetical protein
MPTTCTASVSGGEANDLVPSVLFYVVEVGHDGGRGFESRRPPTFMIKNINKSSTKPSTA